MKRKSLLISSFTSMFLLVSGSAAYAQPRIDGLVDIFKNVMELVFPLGGLVAVMMIVYGGYMWMIAGGDPNKTKQAQGTLTWAILGLVFLAVFGLLLDLVFDFLG